MTEQLLHGPEVGAGIEEMRRKAVPEAVDSETATPRQGVDQLPHYVLYTP